MTWGRLRRISVVGLLAITACGYSLGGQGAPGGLRAIAVQTNDEYGADVDAEALVSRAVRRQVAQGPATALAHVDEADGVLRVHLVSSTASLAPFSDPRSRAARYRVEVRVLGDLTNADGKVVWRSSTMIGEADYLSTPGALEALDGARRRALERAAEDAARKLLRSMTAG